jgi:uncharacterized protein YeaO (DUF488 family)
VNKIELKRVYEPAAKTDGRRVLVERLWPRGVSKESAHIDAWLKEIAPSTELRKWYGHEVERWPGFRKRYEAELKENREAVAQLLKICRSGTTTLVYSAHDEEHNSAVVLRSFILRRLRAASKPGRVTAKLTRGGSKK